MLAGKTIDIIPVGNSCLNGHQLDRSAHALSQKYGETLSSTSSFFKWIFQDPTYVGSFFRIYLSEKKNISADQLDIEQGHSECAFISRTNTWFMHDLLSPENVRAERAISDAKHEKYRNLFGPLGFFVTKHQKKERKRERENSIRHVVNKFNYLLEKLRASEKKEKRIFVFGNGDVGPLSWDIYRRGHIDVRYTKLGIEDACAEIAKAFPSGENIFVYVAHENNVIDGLDCCYQFITSDRATFHELDDEWDDIFAAFPERMGSPQEVLAWNRDYASEKHHRRIVLDGTDKRLNIDETQVSRRNSVFDISGKNGIVIWGPYVNLRPGRYEVEFFFSTPPQGECVLDVAHESGEVIISSNFGTERLSRNSVARLRFETTEKMTNMETRMAIVNGFTATLSKIVITRH